MKFIFLLSYLIICNTAFAEDIDLFIKQNSEITGKPQILIIFDTSASMALSMDTHSPCDLNNAIGCSDSWLTILKAQLIQLINEHDDVDFALMRFNKDNGGYLVSRLGADNTVVAAQIEGLVADDNATPLSETLWEAHLYITGDTVDYAEGVDGRDLLAEQGNKQYPFKAHYVSPFLQNTAAQCHHLINILLITNSAPSDDDGKNSLIQNKYEAEFLTAPSPVNTSYLAALAKVIHHSGGRDLFLNTDNVKGSVRVHTISLGSQLSAESQYLLATTAKNGAGQYQHVDNDTQLSDALKNTVSQIKEINKRFVTSSTTSNQFNQMISGDSLYLSFFKPKLEARWQGDLKKLKISGNSVIDSAGQIALDEQGLNINNAKSFWLPINNTTDKNINNDGGVSVHLETRPVAERNLYTEKQGLIIEFNTALIENEQENVTHSDIQWAMGFDIDDEDSDKVIDEPRKDIFGDPLHSKPVVIHYDTNDTRLLIGTNAGFLHLFQDSGDTVNESWAFIPSALYPIIQPLRNNFLNTKVYGMDGPISLYFSGKQSNTIGINERVIDAKNGGDVWAFAGMRRGGKNYYGLNITDPDKPKMLWRKPIEGGKGDFKELAQTWSKPTIAYIKAFGDKPLLIFGGGYDTNKDNEVRSNDTQGRGIYIVDAQSGERLWALTPDINGFTGKHSIAADIALLDANYDGYIDRMYAGDTGGNLWRIDMPGSDSSQFSFFKLAELGGQTAPADRRFFNKPLIARTLFSKVTETIINGNKLITRVNTPYDAIIIGSGNRSKPLSVNQSDQFFMIRDENIATQSFKYNPPAPITFTDLMQMNNDPFGHALNDVTQFVAQEARLGEAKGWRYELALGEKSLSAASVVGGVTYFTSFNAMLDEPSQGQCTIEHAAGAVYAFHLHFGTKVYDELTFITNYNTPVTPSLYLGESVPCSDTDCDNSKTQTPSLYLIGPSIKGDARLTPLQAVEIIGPNVNVVDGKIQLTTLSDLTLKTQQRYIYKRVD